MNRWLLALLVLVAAALLLGGCGSAKRSEPVAGTFTSDDPKVRRGELVFDKHCHKCHTGGEAALGPGLSDKPLPEFLMRFQQRHGLGQMPAFDEGEMSDADVEAVAAYLKALRHHKH